MSDSKSSHGQKGSKVLRIGIVQRRKIIDERELKRREPVSVGTSAQSTFSVSSDELPADFELFAYDGQQYFLQFQSGMEGKIQLTGEEVLGFEGLRQEGKVVKRDDLEAIALSDASRGKVAIGDITVLFQFKNPVAAPIKPVLPADIRGSLLQNIDAQFTAIFVVVAILQISVVTYARSLPYIEPTSIEEIDTAYQRLIMPDRIPEPPKEPLADTSQADQQKKATEKKPAKKAEKKKASAKKGPAKAQSAKAKKEALAKKVAGKGLLKVLGAKGSKSGGALQDVFEEGGGAMGDLGEAFSGIQGVDIATSGGQSGTRGGGSGEGVGIGELATEGGGSVKTGQKKEASVKGSAAAQAPEVDGELSQSQISRVMRRQLKSLRDCYERALKRNRTLSGKIVIRFEILENGRTANIEFEDDMGSREVTQCIARRAKYWRFPKPDGGSVDVAYPIVFTPSS